MKSVVLISPIVAVLFFFMVTAEFNPNPGRNFSPNPEINPTVPVEIPAIKKYEIKSGIITFEKSVAGMPGKEILYFDDYGIKELVEEYSNNQVEEATLADGTTMYKLKPSQKTAYKMGDASRGVAYKFDYAEISAQDKEQKVKKLPNITIAGKDCESYSYESHGIITTYAGWSHICLLTEQKMKFGNTTIKAVKIEENVTIEKKKKKIPQGYQIK